MSQAETKPETVASTPDVSSDAVAAIEAKRDTLKRVANTDYPAAEHAEALLEIVDNTS
jgi:hypothetical protein